MLDAAGKLRPASRAYHLRRADCHARRGDASAAEQERRAAEALPLASPLDHFLVAKDLYRRGSWAEALAHFDTTLTRQPGHFWSNCLSAICCLQLQRPVPAWSKLTACLQTEPDLAWLHELRGFASYQIAGLARSAAETMQARGGTLRSEIEHQLQSAEADYQRALELLDAAPSPTLRYAVLLNRGLLWLERREWDRAEADLQAAMRLDDKQWQPFEILAQVYRKQDQARPGDRAVHQGHRVAARLGSPLQGPGGCEPGPQGPDAGASGAGPRRPRPGDPPGTCGKRPLSSRPHRPRQADAPGCAGGGGAGRMRRRLEG